jgi:anthranilate/para-aminobenzoate synthase component II
MQGLSSKVWKNKMEGDEQSNVYILTVTSLDHFISTLFSHFVEQNTQAITMARHDLESDATYPVLNNNEVPIAPPPRSPARTLAEAAQRMRARRNEIQP